MTINCDDGPIPLAGVEVNGPVGERMILNLHGAAFICRIEVGPFGNSPALENAVPLQVQVVVEVGSVVFLPGAFLAPRFGSFAEVPLATVLFEGHSP